MVPKLLIHLLPFLLPFAVFAIYVLIARSSQHRGEAFREGPWYWLTALGMVLSIASLLTIGLLEPASTEGSYVPARIVDGEVVAPRYEP